MRRLGVDLVKIDGGFVSNPRPIAGRPVFVRMLIELARHIGLETVAEWVEDEADS